MVGPGRVTSFPPSAGLGNCSLQSALAAVSGCREEPRQLQSAWAAVSLQWAAAQGGGVQVSVGPSPIDKLRVRARGGGVGEVAQIQGHPPGSVLAWAGTGYWQKLLEVTKYRKLSYNNKQSLYQCRFYKSEWMILDYKIFNITSDISGWELLRTLALILTLCITKI